MWSPKYTHEKPQFPMWQRKGGRGYKGVGGGREGFDEYCNQACFVFRKTQRSFTAFLIWILKAEGEIYWSFDGQFTFSSYKSIFCRLISVNLKEARNFFDVFQNVECLVESETAWLAVSVREEKVDYTATVRDSPPPPPPKPLPLLTPFSRGGEGGDIQSRV